MTFKKPPRLESSIEQSIVRSIKHEGIRCDKYKTVGRRAAPDRIVLIPGGFAMFLEVKRPGEVMTKLQLQYKADLETLGFLDEEVHSVGETWVALAKFRTIMKCRGVPESLLPNLP